MEKIGADRDLHGVRNARDQCRNVGSGAYEAVHW